MQINIYISKFLLLFPLVFANDIFDHTSIREDCPKPNFNQICGCHDQSTGQDICPPGEKCCNIGGCESQCVIPEPGCPKWGSKADPCIPECLPPQICCNNGCENYCADPVDVCPPWVDIPCENCANSFKCPPGTKCCWDGCRETCVEPTFKSVHCPNDSVLEHEGLWTTFCLSNCNCPEHMLCCDGPCDCEVDVCRTPDVQIAKCPGFCFPTGNDIPCTISNDCFYYDQLCCDCSGQRICVDPELSPDDNSFPPIFFK